MEDIEVSKVWADEMTEIEQSIIRQWFKTPQGRNTTERQIVENNEPSRKAMLADICRELNPHA